MNWYTFQIAYMGIVGGKSEEDTIERVLAATVGTSIARSYNWNGLKNKKAFKKLELSSVIFGVCNVMFFQIQMAS